MANRRNMSPEQETNTTAQPDAGSTEGTVSPETSSVSQETSQPQNSGTTTVDSSSQQASSASVERPKVSDFYNQRNRLKRIESQLKDFQSTAQQISELKDAIQKLSSSSAPKSNNTIDESKLQDLYWADPVKFQIEREKMLRSEMEKKVQEHLGMIENEIPKYLEKTEKQKEFTRQNQEALDILFPKNDSNKHLSDDDRIQADPQRLQIVGDIIKEWDLQEMVKTNPLKAAKLIDKFVKDKMAPTVSQAVPKKSHLSTTVSGGIQNPSSKKTLDTIQQEIRKLHEDLSKNPELRNDDKFQNRKNQLNQELTRIVKESQT